MRVEHFFCYFENLIELSDPRMKVNAVRKDLVKPNNGDEDDYVIVQFAERKKKVGQCIDKLEHRDLKKG